MKRGSSKPIATFFLVFLFAVLLGFSFCSIDYGDIGFVQKFDFSNVSVDINLPKINFTKDEPQKIYRGPLYFRPENSTMKPGETQVYHWIMTNQYSRSFLYWAQFSALSCPAECPSLTELNVEWFRYRTNPNGGNPNLLYTIRSETEMNSQVIVSVPQGTPLGNYTFRLSTYRYGSNELFYDTPLRIEVVE